MASTIDLVLLNALLERRASQARTISLQRQTNRDVQRQQDDLIRELEVEYERTDRQIAKMLGQD